MLPKVAFSGSKIYGINFWKGGRVVEGDGLENRCGLTSTVGSNPSPSANLKTLSGERVFKFHRGNTMVPPLGVRFAHCHPLLRGMILYQKGRKIFSLPFCNPILFT